MDIKTYLNKSRGNAKRLADQMQVPLPLVSQWKNGRPIPAERCPVIERLTDRQVTCEELRPDVDWAYLRNSTDVEAST